jgi:hypothetical protein
MAAGALRQHLGRGTGETVMTMTERKVINAMRRLFAAPAWTWPDALPDRIEHSPGRSEQPAVLRRA